MKLVLLYVTTSSELEAKEITRTLLAEHLIASANIIRNVVSFYEWGGKVKETVECVLIAKTREALADKVVERAESLHSYECPGILILPVQSGSAAYLDWVAAETEDLK